jgi:L-lactate permease
MVILTSQITSRIAVYYGILIFFVPYIASGISKGLDWIGVDDSIRKVDDVWDAHAPSFLQWVVDMVPDSTWASMPERIISLILFLLVIPTLLNVIDEKSRSMAEHQKVHTEKVTEKKDT